MFCLWDLSSLNDVVTSSQPTAKKRRDNSTSPAFLSPTKPSQSSSSLISFCPLPLGQIFPRQPQPPATTNKETQRPRANEVQAVQPIVFISDIILSTPIGPNSSTSETTAPLNKQRNPTSKIPGLSSVCFPNSLSLFFFLVSLYNPSSFLPTTICDMAPQTLIFFLLSLMVFSSSTKALISSQDFNPPSPKAFSVSGNSDFMFFFNFLSTQTAKFVILCWI